MLRLVFAMLAALAPIADTSANVISVCELSKDFARFRNKRVAVRGVYYYGLRQQCTQKCAIGAWPSFIHLIGGTDDAAWTALARTQREVESKAKVSGERFEVWVTVVGHLEASPKRSPLGPCDKVAWGAYGHLGAFPAQLVVTDIRDIQVTKNPRSPYDYAHVYHGPA